MVTEEWTVSRYNNPGGRDETSATGVRLGSDDSRRAPVVFKMTRKKKSLCLYLFFMDFCSIIGFWGCLRKCRDWKERGGKKKRQQMEQKDCRGKEGLPGLWEKKEAPDGLASAALHSRRGSLEACNWGQMRVNHFFSSPLHCQLYGNKAQNRSGDLRLCRSSGSWPVFLCFCLKGDTFPFQTYVWMWAQYSNDFIFDLCFKSLDFLFFFFLIWFVVFLFFNPFDIMRAGWLCGNIFTNGPTTTDLTSTTHSVLTLTCKCMDTLKKKKRRREISKNKYLISFLKKKKSAFV